MNRQNINWKDYCPSCLHFDNQSNICSKINYNIAVDPEYFHKKCTTDFYDLNSDTYLSFIPENNSELIHNQESKIIEIEKKGIVSKILNFGKGTFNILFGIYFLFGIIFNNYTSCQNYKSDGAVKWFFFDDLFGLRGLLWPFYMLPIDNSIDKIDGKIINKPSIDKNYTSILDIKNDYFLLTHFLGGATTTQDEYFYSEFDKYTVTISTYPENKTDSLKHFAREYMSYTKSFQEDIVNSVNLYINENVIKMPQFVESLQLIDKMKEFGLPDEIIDNLININQEFLLVLDELYIEEKKINNIETIKEFLSYLKIKIEIDSFTMQNAYNALFEY